LIQSISPSGRLWAFSPGEVFPEVTGAISGNNFLEFSGSFFYILRRLSRFDFIVSALIFFAISFPFIIQETSAGGLPFCRLGLVWVKIQLPL